jgi:ornithine cyclodeaminase
MRVVSAAEIDAALAFPALIDALAQAFAGDYVVPTRHHHEITRPDSNATLLLMPAWSGPAERRPYIGTKIVSVFPGNAMRALPTIMGTYVLADGATGAPLAALDGARLTLWRTACASALAARYLAHPQARRLLMVGAGALAPFMIQAHMATRPIETVDIWNRNIATAESLAARLRNQGIHARASGDLEASARKADIISCATLSRDPLIKGEWLKTGAHLDMAGAFNLQMREADDTALLTSRVHIDTKAALKEGGDVAVAIRNGTYTAEQVVGDLFDLATGRVSGRDSDSELTLFKSIGTAIEDLAAAILVWETLTGGTHSTLTPISRIN